tara:strand:+ start:597 stop:2009 length:1413 start_codon:yes stop_codon:yes gene_type:complete
MMHSNKTILIPAIALIAGSAAIYSSQTLANAGDLETTSVLVEPDAEQRHAMSMAFNISEAFSYAAEQIEPSVVHITTRTNTRRGTVNGGLGSGVIVDESGHIVTNNHVIENGNSIMVRLYDGRELNAELIGTFAETDIAVLKVEADDLKPARFADSEALKVGQWVLAVGSPFGYDQTVTAGIVSAKGRSGFGPDAENIGSRGLQEFIQTDAAINPGNSGGPLVDLNGNIVGINTAIISRSGASNGLGFAIPSDIAQSVAEQIIETGDVERGWLGIEMAALDPAVAHEMGIDGGVVIGRILEDGPAEKAELRPRDIITKIGGRTTENLVRLSNAIMLIKPNEPAEITYIRNGDLRTTSAILSDRDREQIQNAGGAFIDELGIGVIPHPLAERISPTRRRTIDAYQIVNIEAGSVGDEMGLEPGDFIVEIDGQSIPNAERLENYFRNALRGMPIRLSIVRDGEALTATVTPE